MRLSLSDVTLLLIETREHELANLAVQESVSKVDFGEVLIFTNEPQHYRLMEGQPRFVAVPDWPEKIGWSRCLWQEVAPHLRTGYVLSIQWDSWVWDPVMWRDEYLHYDYIGAPWWYKDGLNVGNGGFSLRSTALMRFLRKHRAKLPCANAMDDDLLCRKYRIELQDVGFVWAPEYVARDFAFEYTRPSPTSRHFGFHGAFNFGAVLNEDELIERMKIMRRSPYIRENSRMWEGVCKNNPEAFAKLEKVSA